MKLLSFLFSLSLTLAVWADDPASFEVGGLKFTRPADWAWVPVTSPMRKAQLKVAAREGDQSADITFFHFGPSSGGDVNTNVQRWLGQFGNQPSAPKIEPQEIGGIKVTLVSTEGTFSSGMPGGPSTKIENQALLGAIIEAPEGNVFVKMTGPAPLIKSTRQKFIDFVTRAIPPKK